MKHIACWAWVVMAVVPLTLQAQDDAPDTPAQQFQALQQEFNEARQEFSRKYSAATTDEERQQLVANMPNAETYAPRFIELARNHSDDPAALEALMWVVNNTRTGPSADEAIQVIMAHHYGSDQLGSMMMNLVYRTHPSTEEFLVKVIEENTHEAMQGQACLALANYFKQSQEYATMLQDETRREQLAQYFGEEVLEYLDGRFKGDTVNTEIESLYQRVLDEFAAIEGFRGSLGELAEQQLYEIRYLAVGREAPEIVGEDVEGEEFKLSDYRGKVVMLDFWGDW